MTTATQSRKVATQKTVLILARYFIFATQSVVYLVRNGGGKEYQVTLNQNGTSVCIQTNGEPCPSTRGTHKCYHIGHCTLAENTRKSLLAEKAQKAQAAEELKHPFRLYHNLLNNWLYIERQGQPDSLGFPQWLPVLDSNADKVNFAMYQREEAETLLADLLDAAKDAEVIRVQRVEYGAVKYRVEVIDEEFEAWKRENGLDQPMSREAFDAVFDPNGWELL